jgi:hypothetical protein
MRRTGRHHALYQRLHAVEVRGCPKLDSAGEGVGCQLYLRGVSDVSDVKPTELMASIAELNEGRDFKGLKLRTPTNFCIGATIDLGRCIE